VDKSAPLDDTTLVAALDDLIAEMHADGSLSASSTKWYGVDYSIQQGA
jgi:ABC-type amino acid transport substrate-binding protein